MILVRYDIRDYEYFLHWGRTGHSRLPLAPGVHATRGKEGTAPLSDTCTER